VLLFLRGHDEVMRAVVRDDAGQPLIEAERGVAACRFLDVGGRLAGAGRREPTRLLQPIEGRFEPRSGPGPCRRRRGD